MGRVVVVGSYNVGLTVVGPTLPLPGQSLTELISRLMGRQPTEE